MILLFCIITITYVALIACFIYGFYKVPVFTSEEIQDSSCFSIIIPFRNEATNLPKLLESLEALKYYNHLFEILFVDDNSSDASVAIITTALQTTSINFKILNNERVSKAPKKDAITTAIKKSKHPWIVTTDADCQVPKQWLKVFNQVIKNTHATMLVAPVNYSGNDSFLHQFQTLDFYGLQTSTIGGFGLKHPFLCNGANLVYHKEVFLEAKGFESNNTIASGDDVFLMESLLQKKSVSIFYVKSKNAVVTTTPENSWSELYQQRLRWASKTSNYSRLFPKLIGLLVLLMNCAVIVMSLLYLTNLRPSYYFLILLGLKIGIDFLAIFKIADFFNTKKPLVWYALSVLIHPFFIVLIATNSLLFKFKWKGRSFKA